MEMRIFQAAGKVEIDKLEREINSWMAETLTFDSSVKHINTAMCQVGEDKDGEKFQQLVITIWHSNS